MYGAFDVPDFLGKIVKIFLMFGREPFFPGDTDLQIFRIISSRTCLSRLIHFFADYGSASVDFKVHKTLLHTFLINTMTGLISGI